MIDSQVPIIGFSAYSGTGKTTLIRKVIPLLKARGLRITVIKHAHHDFELDIPGKDSYELRKAGADQTIICTTSRMARINEFDDPAKEPSLEEIVASLDGDQIDLVLVEGYKHVRFAKIEMHRTEMATPYLHLKDDSIIAIACDAKLPNESKIPTLDINDIEGIAQFIYEEYYLPRARD